MRSQDELNERDIRFERQLCDRKARIRSRVVNGLVIDKKLLEQVASLVKLVILRNIRKPDYESIVNKMANGFRTEGMYLGTRKFAFHVGQQKYVIISTEVDDKLFTVPGTSMEVGEEGDLVIRVFYESGSAMSSIGREIERIRVEDNCEGPLGEVARLIERTQGLHKFTLNSAVMVC